MVFFPRRTAVVASSAVVASLFYATIHNDSQKKYFPAAKPSDQNSSNTLNTLAWGRNNLLAPKVAIKKPSTLEWLDNVALRDLALHDDHAACVDARGDLYQWGVGHASPIRTLSGKDISNVQVCQRRVFALSKSGRVYALDANATGQVVSAPWWKFWATPEPFELTPNARGVKFVQISAGGDHLLALTSTGRTFSYPISKNANAHGQLGPNIPATDDCTTLYELPVLKGTPIAQLATGDRSSFARTPTGKVLAWGANEHGQLGLGEGFISTAITIPTEVVLWPTKSQQSTTRCLDVCAGGDLTAFVVERAPTDTVELLMCGDGQWGGLGNNMYSTAQISPTRVRTLSELVEYDTLTQRVKPIKLHSISISRSGHVLATLNPSSGDRDLLGWGRNHDQELGTGLGKRSGVPSPVPVDVGDGRLLLKRKSAPVRDLQGNIYGYRSREVEQFAVANTKSSILYWREA
ncbi:regulator of chromosome condensation 1/beta-lactamase-inhibitor protein II [Roridomyces roridus]|uniref:Regulator of chromosome condensation 1/beta-lactamase-inhibitor protein II n=1 Tax=Roridomyces roridus TaxID=1738132 RepID=A0AAD7BW92_9AGAR|nr:regulator of chromosome condensation 1/beta-lactamase-inhibitor protein II [Roridomyces roridus]